MAAQDAPRPDSGGPLHHALDEAGDVLALAARFPEPPPSRWARRGLSARGERVFTAVAFVVLALFLVGWSWSLNVASTGDRTALDPGSRRGLSLPTARIAAALTEPDAPTAAFLTEAALNALAPQRGLSGSLRAVVRDPGEPLGVSHLPEEARVRFAEGDVAAGDSTVAPATVGDAVAEGDSVAAPTTPGIWRLVVAAGRVLAPIGDLRVITRRPLADRRNGRIGQYVVGAWPTERRAHRGYTTPSGFIEVTRENQDTPVSDHFQLRDFLTKGQANVWPKYLVLELKLVDKLELVLADLQEQGIRTAGVTVMSGFRTPTYNSTGGNTAGRASLSRHMYGDAADVFIDNDGNGVMDDLNGDGRVDVGDARVVAAAAERVERRHPTLIGGIGIYTAGPGHGPFVHIDTRGFRARW